MERITSCESTLSELVTVSSSFNVGDRVRRVGGAINVPTDIKLVGSGTSGTVRYVGPICKKQEEVQNIIVINNLSNNNNNNNSNAFLLPSCSSMTSISPSESAPSSPAVPSPQNQQSSTSSGGGSAQPPLYIGVEWDQRVGKNDGSVEGIRYFTCEPGYGSLLLPKNLSKGLPLAALLEARYGSSTVRQEAGTITTASAERNTQTRPLQLGPAIGFRDPNTGAFVKVVNCDCTANEQLQLASTCGGDRLAKLFPNLRDLSIAATLIATWDEVKMIVSSLPNLATLDLSRNPALGAPTLNKERHRQCFLPPIKITPTNDDDDNRDQNEERRLTTSTTSSSSLSSVVVLSTSVRELRISDVGLLTPDCVEFILNAFSSLELFFAARDGLTMKNHPKRGSNTNYYHHQVKALSSASTARESGDLHHNSNSASLTTPLSNSQTQHASNQNQNDRHHQKADSNLSLLSSTKSHTDNKINSNITQQAVSRLKYLNIEGNEGIEYFEDVVDLIGPHRCLTLTALNVSSTGITDAPHLPPVQSEVIEKLPNSYFNHNTINNQNNSSSTTTSTTNSPSRIALNNNNNGVQDSPAKNSEQDNGANNNNNNSGESSQNQNDDQQQQQQLVLPAQPPPPLFPNLQSLYMSSLRVYSWLSLSRLLHRAADCIHGTLSDVHFSTSAGDEDAMHQQDSDNVDDGLSTTADENYYDTASSSVMTFDDGTAGGGDGGSFLPDDFRDRRRMSVAFMPTSVKKFNRSEITNVERASAITRSVPSFYQLTKRIQVRNADDPENAEEIEIVDAKRLGDLPRHLQKLVVKEHIRTTRAVSSSSSIASGSVGYIYRPSTIGPRTLVNEVEVNVRCVLMQDANHLSSLRQEFFKSVLKQAREDDDEENALERTTSSSSTNSSNNNNSQNSNSRRDLSSKQFGKLKLRVDVRWEVQQLEAAVRDALGMESPTSSSSSISAKGKKTPIALFHIDKELMANPGAVAQGLHCKFLVRAWEKLFVTKISENDDVIACVGP